MSRAGLIRCSAAGPYRAHYIRVIRRIGDPSDSAGEHAIVEIAECADAPHVVGRNYRMCIRGGPPWHVKLTGADLVIALQAPHILDELGIRGA